MAARLCCIPPSFRDAPRATRVVTLPALPTLDTALTTEPGRVMCSPRHSPPRAQPMMRGLRRMLFTRCTGSGRLPRQLSRVMTARVL